MKLLVEPSDRTVKEEAVERLERRTAEKLDSRDIEHESSVRDSLIIIDVKEGDAPVAASASQHITGASAVYPCITSDTDAHDIARRLEEEEVEPQGFEVEARGENTVPAGEISEALESEGWSSKEGGKTIRIWYVDREAFISMEILEAPGGLPIGEEDALLPMKDRLSVYAGFLMMKEGYRIVPLVKGSNTDSVEEGIELLEEYQPGLKPLLMDLDSWEEAVGKALKVMEPEVIVLGALEGEEAIIDEGGFEASLERPLSGMDEEEALERYGEIMYFRV